MDERELCIYKDRTKQRRAERIPIICRKIRQLWIYYREKNEGVGFCYITGLLQIKANEDGRNLGMDSFYWEEDVWFDKITEWIEDIGLSKESNLSSQQLDIMAQIVRYFENYWMLYPDLRLQQILELFDNVVGDRRDREILGVDWWKNIMVPEQINILTNSIKTLEENIKEAENKENSLIKYSVIDKKKYIELMNTYIESTKQQLEFLKREYGIE